MTLKVDTQGFGGKKIEKDARVFTNDPFRKVFSFVLVGGVVKPADIQPRRLQLRGRPGEEIKAVSTITPMKGFSFGIVKTYADSNKHIRFDLREDRGKFILTVHNTKNQIGRYWDSIHLVTDLENNPEILINIRGHIYQGNGKP